MRDRNFAIAFLSAIERKHHDYFVSRRLNIMQCVEIEGTVDACVHVTQDDLPPEIRYDIEVMYWRTDLNNYTPKKKQRSGALL
ncbi:MAG: hypothetical protein NVSMB24_38940 [Mucilaginibacter sp.]